jgi:hypothetical protein
MLRTVHEKHEKHEKNSSRRFLADGVIPGIYLISSTTPRTGARRYTPVPVRDRRFDGDTEPNTVQRTAEDLRGFKSLVESHSRRVGS